MRISKNKKTTTEISTASLPDIVFLLLFFFMVSATIQTEQNLLDITPPKAHALTSVQKKFLVRELQVGYPKDTRLGTSPRISSQGRILALTDIGHWVQEQRSSLDEMYKDQLIVMIRADQDTDMGLINDIGQELRTYHARKIIYRSLDD